MASASNNTTSYKIADNLYLVSKGIAAGAAPAKSVEVPTNHIMEIDCSGSMSWDIPRIREQLKRKIPKLIREGDTLSVVWFSGRNEFGVLLEAEPVATLTDLTTVNAAIDKYLKPVGLTGFKQPLEEVEKLVERIAKKRPNTAFSLFFQSDGCDNQWGRAEILKAVEKAGSLVQSVTIVEYGYYADRNLLAAMAEKAGGALIFSEDFDRYMPIVEAVLQKRPVGGKRVEVDIKADAVGGFAFALDGGDLLTFGVTGTTISVPENLQQVFFLSPAPVGNVAKASASTQLPEAFAQAAYAALSLYATRMKPEVVFPLLRATGDVTFIDQFANCFGKQKYSEFQEATKTAALDPSKRLVNGFNPNKVPRDDAFTVLDLLDLLQQDESARVLLDDERFKYSRIGRARLDATEHLTDEEMEKVRDISAKIASERDAKKIKALNDEIASITAAKPSALKFTQTPAPGGYPMLKLTFAEDRPNVSFMVKREGTVDLSARITPEFKGKVPETFPTYVYRNYAVIKDGLVNIDQLPVRVSADTYSALTSEDGAPYALDSRNRIPDTDGLYSICINLKAIPVINRKMVKATSAKAYFTAQYALTKAQAAQKVYNTYSKDLLPGRKSEGYASQYGEAGAAWLKEQGLTDYGGFSPTKTVQAPATDFYMGKELKCSLKGLSSLPKLADAKAKLASGKPNAPTLLMKDSIEEVESFLASPFYVKAGNKEAVLEAWLDGQAKAAREKCRKLIFDIASNTFAIVVGQVWFSEFSSLDENSLSFDVEGTKVEGKVEMREIQINI